MNLNDNTNRLTETAIIITLMTIFIIIGLNFLPLILMLYPIPFVILGVRHDVKHSLVSIIASTILIGILVDIFTGLFILVVFGSSAMVLAYLIEKKYKPYKTIGLSAAISALSVVAIIAIISYISGISFSDQMESFFNEAYNIQVKIMEGMQLSGQQQNQLKDILKYTIDYTILIIPSIIIVFSIFTSYINYWLSVSILRRMGYNNIKQMPEFKYFSLPRNIILGSAVMFFGTMILRYFKFLYYDTILLNIVTILSFVFFVQGLSVIVYLIDKINIHKIIKIILITILIIYFPVSMIISLLGVIDVIFDFRKLRRRA